METSNKLCYWFLFYKDQLLLQKENDTYTIPYGENPQFRFLIRWRLITGMDFRAYGRIGYSGGGE